MVWLEHAVAKKGMRAGEFDNGPKSRVQGCSTLRKGGHSLSLSGGTATGGDQGKSGCQEISCSSTSRDE